MVDLLVDTEFVKVGKDKYMNKLSNGIIYSKSELKELLKKNNEELQKQAKTPSTEETKNAIKPKTIQSNTRHKSKKQARN